MVKNERILYFGNIELNNNVILFLVYKMLENFLIE